METTQNNPADKHLVTYKEQAITLTRHETQGKGDKSKPVAYWGIDASQFSTSLPATATLDEHAKKQLDTLATLIGWQTVRDMTVNTVNRNLKSAQCEQGKDVYTMENKAQYAKDYILADFGVNSKGGGQAIKALKELSTKQGDLLAKMAALFAKLQKAAPQDAPAIMAELMTVQAEVAKLATPTA